MITDISPTIETEPTFEHFSIWGTTASFGVTDPAALTPARVLLDEVLKDIDGAANRFIPESEIHRVNAASGLGPVLVTTTFFDLATQSLWAYKATEGASDPTVADALIGEGYDRDFDDLVDQGLESHAHPAPGMDAIVLDEASSTIDLPDGVHLDFGSTAKARASDLAAAAIADALGVGVLVSLGGDLRVCGPAPEGGWIVGIAQSARSAPKDDEIDEVVAIREGALASSSSVVRQWTRQGTLRHHIIDPATGQSAETPFGLVSVVAPTCVEANAFSTAAIIWGDDALFHLPQRSLPARLVRLDGSVERVGGWPEPLVA